MGDLSRRNMDVFRPTSSFFLSFCLFFQQIPFLDRLSGLIAYVLVFHRSTFPCTIHFLPFPTSKLIHGNTILPFRCHLLIMHYFEHHLSFLYRSLLLLLVSDSISISNTRSDTIWWFFTIPEELEMGIKTHGSRTVVIVISLVLLVIAFGLSAAGIMSPSWQVVDLREFQSVHHVRPFFFEKYWMFACLA